MAADDISTPLGVDLDAKRNKRRALPLKPLLGGAALLIAGGFAVFATINRDPLGGEPYAVASIVTPEKQAERVEAAPAPPVAAAMAPEQPAERELSTAEELEAESGIKVHRGKGSAPAALIIQVPDEGAGDKPAAPDKALSQSGRHGVLPVISADGRRPLDVYARPVKQADKEKSPRIAIIVGGLGIGQANTARAIKKLPGEVTLAFAPYGADLSRQVAAAREGGHEIMLHAPMEPYDYPDNDPGPQTLVSGQKAGATQDRLHWLMSRFQGYVGVMNFMGARFLASEQDFQVVASDLAGRGLGFLHDASVKDDGSVALMRANGGAAAGADLMIDIVSESRAIDQALAKLESIAKSKGSAIGVASALPVSVDRLDIWAKSLKEKGITLVPVSAMLR
jgi:uncharacterized protein